MPEFDVKATDAEGDESNTREAAPSVEELVKRLRAKGLQASEVRGSRARRLFEPRGVDLEEFAFFNAELASACKGGAPLPGALRALARDLSGSRAREALEAVAADVEGGVDLADALAGRSDVFPPGYVALVSAGLKSGNLAGTLLLFAEEARLSAGMRHRLHAALAYQLVVLFAGAFFLAFLSRFFVPVMADIYGFVGPGGLPSPTRFFLSAAPVMRWAPLVAIVLAVGVYLAWRLVSRGAVGARVLGRLALSLPVAGKLLRAVAVARFCRTLANALSAKVPVPDAVTLAGFATGNAAVRDEADKVAKAVAEGSTISDGLAEYTRIFPAAVVWMLHVSEGRGEPVPALEECARLEEGRMRRLGELLPLFLATALTLVGAMILMMSVLAVFMPIIRLSGGLL